MTNSRIILLFTRAPEAEARAKQLPVREGSRLFAGFLQEWQHRAGDAGAELLVVTPPSSIRSMARLLPSARIAAQSGDTFASRIESAFALAFDQGAESVLMVGGDGAPLCAAETRDAFEHLESGAPGLVLTPAADGGVNAIGFSARAERPLDGIAWHSPNVCSQLTAAARRCGLSLLVTSSGHDLDGAGNIAALYRASRTESCWRAFRWLLLCVLLVGRHIAEAVIQAGGTPAILTHVTRGPPLSCSETHA